MSECIDVVKRLKRGNQPFEADKLSKSIMAACLSVSLPQGEADQVADMVVHDVQKWLGGKQVITSADIRHVVYQKLSTYHPDVAYMYKHYRHII